MFTKFLPGESAKWNLFAGVWRNLPGAAPRPQCKTGGELRRRILPL
jgi:hypothetical protein